MSVMITVTLIVLVLAATIPWMIRRAYRVPRIRIDDTPDSLNLPSRDCRIATANGKWLSGWLIGRRSPDDRQPAVAVMHGWGGSAAQMLPFATLLHKAGYAVLLLDARNHGNSDSDSFSSMPRFAEDLEHGIEWLKNQPGIDQDRLFLLGHSVGAAACLLLASRRQDLAGVISIASFAHPRDLMRRQMQSHHIPYIPMGWLILHYIEKTIGFSFDDIAPCNTIRHISCPTLLIHGKADKFIPFTDAETIYAHRSGDHVQLLLLKNTGHNSIGAISRHGEVLLHFLDSCLPESDNTM